MHLDELENIESIVGHLNLLGTYGHGTPVDTSQEYGHHVSHKELTCHLISFHVYAKMHSV